MNSRVLKHPAAIEKCDCGSGQPYVTCCGIYHRGTAAPNAEALMRSRYSAYVRQLTAYLLDTWHPDTRPTEFNLALDTDVKWLGLKVIAATESDPRTASVEFIARYRHGGGRAERMREVSQFIYTDAWYYLTGEVR